MQIIQRHRGQGADAGSEGVLVDIQAARQGELVGVIERLWEENVSKERATFVDRRADETGQIIEVYSAEVSRLLIFNLAGVVVGMIDDVRRYAWDPGGGRIAYLTGSYSEDRFGFEPTGTWVYDLDSGQAERVYEQGREVEWAAWDGNVYIWDLVTQDTGGAQASVLGFDPETGDLFPTLHQGIHFSPQGTYYFAQGAEGAPPRVFRSDTEEELDVVLSIESADRTRIAGSARGWLDENTLIFPSPDPSQAGDYLYNIESGTARYAPGAVMPEKGPDGGVLILEGASVVERPLSELD